MGINLRKIFPKEFEALEKRDIHCDNINTDILEYMLLDHLRLLSEFKETPLHFVSFGYCRTQRLLTIVPPDYHSEPKTTVPYLNVAYTDDQRAKINLLLHRIEQEYPAGNVVETNRCDASNEYCPYANYPTELLQKALQRNALMDATDEQHVQSLTKEEFDALKNRVQAFIFPDKKQDVELIAQINRIMNKMDEMYAKKASYTQSPSVMFAPKQPESESAAVASLKLI